MSNVITFQDKFVKHLAKQYQLPTEAIKDTYDALAANNMLDQLYAVLDVQEIQYNHAITFLF